MHWLLPLWIAAASLTANEPPSLANFDARATAGQRLNVVFFGASLTWGANASDPNLTSYRAVVAGRLEEAYPQARFKFWDAAIGGTGSQLGVFRLERDVLRRRPDLVFLDFSANDDIRSDNPQTLASYEAILRRLILDAKCPVVQVIFPFRWDVAAGTTDGMQRRDAHLALSRAYQTAVGDAITLAIARVKDGSTTLEKLWPFDGVHPGDDGYRLFADAAWSAFQSGVQEKRACQAPPKMLYADTYLASARVRLAEMGALPNGSRRAAPNPTAAYFDFLMSRWLDSEAVASRPPATAAASEQQQPARLQYSVPASVVMLFGETTKTSGRYRVWIDGQVASYQPAGAKEAIEIFNAGDFGRRIGGNGHYLQVIAEGLDPGREHLLEIEPLLEPGEELRLESICVAGGGSALIAPARGAQVMENSLGMKLVLVEPGEFWMGSPDAEEGRSDDEPRHRVRITRPYYLGQCEVTLGQFRRFVADAGYVTTLERDARPGFGYIAAQGVVESTRDFNWRHTGWERTDEHPVVNVGWEDAVAFCRWLSAKESREYRLPTEAEWEFACRAGTTTRYYTGEAEETLQGAANLADASFLAKYADATWSLAWNDGYPFTAPVGRFRPNPLGLHDMCGNAWEWCADWYAKDYFAQSPLEDPAGPAGGERHVLRGGAFTNRFKYVRSADRDSFRPKYRYNFTGFRVARTAEKPDEPGKP